MDKALLVVVAGQAGTGKTTLARALAVQVRAAYLRTDVIATPLARDSALGSDAEAATAAYAVARALAADNLESGLSVVVDGVHATHERRAAWRSMAQRLGIHLLSIETTVTDPVEHRRRVERRAALVGPLAPSWTSIQAQPYDAWDVDLDGPRFMIETSHRQPALNIALAHLAALDR